MSASPDAPASTAQPTCFQQLDAAFQTARARCHQAAEESDRVHRELLKQHRGRIERVGWDTSSDSLDDGTYASSPADICLHVTGGLIVRLGSTVRIEDAIENYVEHIEGVIENEASDAKVVAFLTGLEEGIADRYMALLQDYIEEHQHDGELVLT